MLGWAGSGKTRTVVGRICKQIESGIEPISIAAISFTRKSGRELEERLNKVAKGVWCGTLHSLCLEIVERRERSVRIITDFERIRMIEKCGSTIGLYDTYAKKWKKKKTDWWAKEIDRHLTRGSSDPDATRVGELYKSTLAAGGDYDYTGLLLKGLEHINNGALAYIKSLFVDEAQDIDDFQWSIIDAIIKNSMMNAGSQSLVTCVKGSILGAMQTQHTSTRIERRQCT